MVTLEEIKSLLAGNNKMRDENLDKKLTKLQENISDAIDKRIKHLKSAPNTITEMENFKENCKNVSGVYSKKIDEMTTKLNENTRMTKEMYEVWKSANWAGKSLVKLFATMGIIAGGILGLIELLKRR